MLRASYPPTLMHKHHEAPDIDLPIGSYRLRFRAAGDLKMPPYAGSAWRGAMGHALKRLFCITDHTSCDNCPARQSCGYTYLFETPLPSGAEKMRKYSAIPHPFVLITGMNGGNLEKGGIYHLGLQLIGRGNEYLPQVIHALQQAGARGFGQGRLQLAAVEQFDQQRTQWRLIHSPGGSYLPLPPAIPAIPPLPRQVKIELRTPLRLKYEGCIAQADTFTFGRFFSSLLRRLSMLSYFHGATPLETDFRALIQKAHGISVQHRHFHWHRMGRYSTRQKKRIDLSGLLGSFHLETDKLGMLWAYLWTGQYIHTGGATTMGLGRYRVVTPERPYMEELDGRYGRIEHE